MLNETKSEIRCDREHVVLLNVFRVQPERADELLATLVNATQDVMANRPGFISANFHRSLDGRSVVNYAQWESVEHFEAMRADPEAQTHMRACAELCDSFTPQLLQLTSVHSRD